MSNEDEVFIESLSGDKWGFFVVLAAQEISEHARQAVDKLKGYIIHNLERHVEPYDKQLPELMDWTVIHIPAADEISIRAAFRSYLAKLNEGRSVPNDLSDSNSDVLQERMCLVVDDDVVESVTRGPNLDQLDEYGISKLTRKVFVKVFNVNHPTGTYEVVAISGRLPIASNQLRYEGWMKATPAGLYTLYSWVVCIGESYGRYFEGPDKIYLC